MTSARICCTWLLLLYGHFVQLRLYSRLRIYTFLLYVFKSTIIELQYYMITFQLTRYLYKSLNYTSSTIIGTFPIFLFRIFFFEIYCNL